MSDNPKGDGKGKREPYYPMPEQIPDTPENIARAVTRTQKETDGALPGNALGHDLIKRPRLSLGASRFHTASAYALC